MTPEEKAAFQYRFQGYQLSKMQLDSTGPSYYVVAVHPYYRNQPLYWATGFSYGPPGASGAPNVSDETPDKLWPFIPLGGIS